MTFVALSIAGSDPSGGAGVQADLKTFHAHGVYGMAVVSLLTVQNSHGVRRVEPVSPQLLGEQLDALFDDVMPRAIKTGALGSAAHVAVVAERLTRGDAELVIDPVMASKSGAGLLDADGCAALKRDLLPRATLLTPNLDEASLLLGREVRDPQRMPDAARELVRLGPRAVLLKGGHRSDDPIDVLCIAGDVYELHAPRIATQHTHGVGCTLSAAITARLALGHSVLDACRLAKQWLTLAIERAPGVGSGQGAVDHLAPLPETGPTAAHTVSVRKLS